MIDIFCLLDLVQSLEQVFRANGGTTPLYADYRNQSAAPVGTALGVTVLVGIDQNFANTATGLGLNTDTFDDDTMPTPQSPAFLTFIQTSIDSGYPVVVGVHEAKLTDPQYDHIVPVIGYETNSAGNVSVIYYNAHNYLHTVRNVDPVRTRAVCNSSDNVLGRGMYNGSQFCLPYENNFGAAVTGNLQPGSFAAQLVLPFSNEPDWGGIDGWYQGFNVPGSTRQSLAAPLVSFTAQLRVFGLTPGAAYTCVRFDSVVAVPSTCSFLDALYALRYDFVAPAAAVQFAVAGLHSNGTYLFRCVVPSLVAVASCNATQPPVPDFCTGSFLSAPVAVFPNVTTRAACPPVCAACVSATVCTQCQSVTSGPALVLAPAGVCACPSGFTWTTGQCVASSSSGLSMVAILGISLGVVAVLVTGIAAIVWWNRNRNAEAAGEHQALLDAALTTSSPFTQLPGSPALGREVRSRTIDMSMK
jgi:hypothetical protein